jgi:hypothetical protein
LAEEEIDRGVGATAMVVCVPVLLSRRFRGVRLMVLVVLRQSR